MQRIRFSNISIIPYDVWFLDGTEHFCERKLLLGRTPKLKTVVSLIEKRIIDGRIFVDTQCGIKAEKIIQNERNRIMYTRQDVLCSKRGKPFGWTYGQNKEIHNNKGEIIAIRQRRCDYFGQSEIVNEERVE